MNFPQDPIMLLSVVNTNLRDHHTSLEDLCKSNDISQDKLTERLAAIDYHYDTKQNQFVPMCNEENS